MPGTRDRRTRHRSVSRKNLRFSFVVPFVVPAVLATGVWGYTAVGLVDEQMQLRAETDHASVVAGPAQELITRLQEERRLTAMWQASRSDDARTELDEAREKTDAAVASYLTKSSSGLDTSALTSAGGKLDEALDNLVERRKALDERRLNSTAAFQYFTGAITRGTDVIAAALDSDDVSLAQAGTATTAVIRLTEMLSREDALISGALPSRQMSETVRAQFLQYQAVQRELRAALTARDLPAGGAASFGEITDSRQWTSIGAVEDAITGARGTDLPQPAPSWPDAAGTVVGDLQTLGADSVRGVGDSASDRAGDLLIGVLLGTAATLAALIAGALLALRGHRSSMDRLTELQQKTEELSGVWLPQLLARIERGERIEPQPVAPQAHHSADEIERLGAAIDHLGRVAADTAVRQSLGREGTEKVFAQLIRRTQILIHRLISLLDDLERKHEDSDLLKDIFKVDHLATRVRRHAENLVILSGAPPSRRMTAPVSITDVMRSAVAETEAYTRVKVKNLPADRRLALTGRAVADVTHLLAELIENGTSFSPPETQVFLSATKVAKGLAVHVEDHGLGMPDDMREKANELLAHPPKLDMTALGEDPRLGHFVVARLAERHKIKVELRESVYGGTLVVMLLPSELLEEIDSPVLDQLKSAAATVNQVQAPSERPGIGGSGAADTDIPPAVAETALAGVGAGARSGGAGDVIAGSAVVPASAGDVLTHTRMPDYSGFPDYGGAGLLPPSSGNGASGESGPTAWAAPQEHPVHHVDPGHGHPGDWSVRSGAESTAGAGIGAGLGAGAGLSGGAGLTGGPGLSGGAGLSAGAGTGLGATSMSRGTGIDAGARASARGADARPGGEPHRSVPTRGSAPAPAANPAQDSGPLTTPTILPQRTRGASLAQQLRKEAVHQPGSDSGEAGLSPDASARAMIAIQQGLKRARISDDTDDREAPRPPRDPGAH
ncbi:sensor histidine kinase [Streptomyces acidicola]|nr:nitrate- and nitrite sensing domain-containing protein [Streptomyces acidicola]